MKYDNEPKEYRERRGGGGGEGGDISK